MNEMIDPTSYPLIDALRQRRSRRFGKGMEIPDGPLAYKSGYDPSPLTEREEAALVFAGTGVTGPALLDLCYGEGHGAGIMAGKVGRTIASGDGIQTVSLVVSNDTATYWIRRPQDFATAELSELIELSKQGDWTELYQRSRIPIVEGRVAPPKEPLFNLNLNRWSAHAPGTSYFLPINDLTFMYINGLLEVFNESTRAFVLDERANFRPAGIGRFARSKRGHLDDDPEQGRVVTTKHVELLVDEFVTIEQGMLLQNLALMAEALGVGGYPNFANHEFGWFQAMGFRMGRMRASRYLGANALVRLGMRLMGKDLSVPYPLALEKEGRPLLHPYCPPYFSSMEEAVYAVVAAKSGSEGVFARHHDLSRWKCPDSPSQAGPGIGSRAIEATIAYCEYLWGQYGRFPVHLAPFRTVVGYQASHLDPDFYDRFYHPDALGSAHRAV